MPVRSNIETTIYVQYPTEDVAKVVHIEHADINARDNQEGLSQKIIENCELKVEGRYTFCAVQPKCSAVISSFIVSRRQNIW